MKQNFKTMLLAGCICLFASCSDDANDNFIELPEGTPTSLTTGYEQGEFSLPINSTGKWTATVQPEDAYWLSLLTEEGNGNGTISYLIEPNATYEQRHASIVITTEGGETLTFPVTQTDMSTSGAGEQLNAELDYSKFGEDTPLGYGMYIKKAQGMTFLNANQIFRVEKLKDTRLQDALYDGEDPYDKYVTARAIPTSNNIFQSDDDLQTASQSIKANLSVDVQYGLFKLGLKGDFNLYGSSSDTIYAYSGEARADVRHLSLKYKSLMEEYDDVPANLQTLVVTKSFAKLRSEIERLVKENQIYTDPDLQTQLGKLNSNYGPVFCAEATQGGSAIISISNTKSSSKDTLAIHGTLGATFSSLFKLNVEASASYLNASSSDLKRATFQAVITGGTQAARTDLLNSLATIVTPGHETTATDLIPVIAAWNATINPDDPYTYTCTSYALMGIWELFSDKAAAEIKRYMKEKYPASGTYMVNLHAMIDEDGD